QSSDRWQGRGGCGGGCAYRGGVGRRDQVGEHTNRHRDVDYDLDLPGPKVVHPAVSFVATVQTSLQVLDEGIHSSLSLSHCRIELADIDDFAVEYEVM